MLRKSILLISALMFVACGDEHQAGAIEYEERQNQQALYDYMPADGVLGQLNFSGTSSPILDAQSLDSPISVAHLGDQLLVADFGNKRVLGYPVDAQGNPSDTASMVLLQSNFNNRNFDGADSDINISPTRLTTDGLSRLFVSGYDSAGRTRVLVFDNPFTQDTNHEYELLDLPENIGAFGSINPDLFIVIGGPGPSDETVHFYATNHLDAPPLRQADVPSPCNGDGGARGFVRLQDYLAVACNSNIYAAPIDTTTGFLEPSPIDPASADWTHVLTGFSNIGAIDGIGGIVNGELREEAFVSEVDNNRIVPLPNPVFYIEARLSQDQDGVPVQAEPYDITLHSDFQRFLGHADLSAGPIDPPEIASGPNYHPDAELRGSPSEWGLWTPTDLSWNNENLWVADFNNNRVMRFSTRIADPSETESEIFTAAQVIGQVDYTHTYSNRIEGRSIVAPTDIALVSTGQSAHLISSDRLTHRVMVHTLADRAANGASADSETLRGQNSLFDYEKNQNTDNDNGEGFENPMCVAVDPVSNRVAICDTGNSRIVVYDAYNSGVTPVAIIGRREGDAQLSQPNIKDVAIHGNFVFAAAGETLEDPDAHRILIYDLRNLSTEDGVPDTMYLPVGAIGQSFDGVSMPANNCNQNNSTGPDTLCNVQHLATDEMGNLWVSDTGNNRVLMFEDPAAHLQVSPTVSALEAGIADHVLGQPNMLSNSQYFGADEEKTFRLIAPDNLTLTGGPEPALWVIDGGNKRVLYFPTPHLRADASGMPEATHVLGTTMNGNQSSVTTANASNVSTPVAVAASPDNNLVFIADSGFSRVLRFTFNQAPTVSLQDTAGSTLSPNIEVEEGSQSSVLVVTNDPEGDEVVLAVEGLSSQLSFDGAAQTLIFDSTGLSPGHVTYATIVATDASQRANQTRLSLRFEIVKKAVGDPTTQATTPEREPETIPEGGCHSLPISTLTLVIPFLLIYRRRQNRT